MNSKTVVLKFCQKCNSIQSEKLEKISIEKGFNVKLQERPNHEEHMEHYINGKILDKEGNLIENFTSMVTEDYTGEDFEKYLDKLK
jgi:hypothetical protein